MNASLRAAVIGAEDGQLIVVRSGQGIYSVNANPSGISILRQTATGLVTVLTLSELGGLADTRVLLGGWPDADHRRLVEEIVGVIGAVLTAAESRLSINHQATLAKFAEHLAAF